MAAVCVRDRQSRSVRMMLRVFLLASLLAVAFADHHDDDHHDDEHHGCCSHEDRHEIEYLWHNLWEASFTERKVMITNAIFEESVTQSYFLSSSSSSSSS